MQEITKQTLDEIDKRFKKEPGYILSDDNPIYCPRVNGLTNICLSELGLNNKAEQNTLNFFKGAAFDRDTGLYHSETDFRGNIVNPNLNSCINSIYSLSLCATGLKGDAKELMENLKESPVYSKSNGFGREYDPDTMETNNHFITQSNLWAALAYNSISDINMVEETMDRIEDIKYDSKRGLFNSLDCKDDDYNFRYFMDDQAIAILAYIKTGERDKADKLAERVLGSGLYDRSTGLFNSSFSDGGIDTTKSTYKNSFMAFALGCLGKVKELKDIQKGLVRYLYDHEEKLFNQTTRDPIKVPDNSALALVVLEYENLSPKGF